MISRGWHEVKPHPAEAELEAAAHGGTQHAEPVHVPRKHDSLWPRHTSSKEPRLPIVSEIHAAT